VLKLPWPDKILNPNSRAHWAPKAKAKREARVTASWLTATKRWNLGKNPKLTITFHPPDNRKRDIDNMLASLKSALDGVSDAIGIDDSEFIPTIIKGDPMPPDGCVTIEFEKEGNDVQD